MELHICLTNREIKDITSCNGEYNFKRETIMLLSYGIQAYVMKRCRQNKLKYNQM